MISNEPKPQPAAVHHGTARTSGVPVAAPVSPAARMRSIVVDRRSAEARRRSSHGALARLRGPAA